jgi:dipeptidyl aminopeptidase/acylaminoacyl peptidase
MKKLFVVALLLICSSIMVGQSFYKLPPKEVVDILDAPPTPMVVVSPRSDAMLLIEYKPHPSISLLAQPFLRLAGIRIDPQLHSRQRLQQYTRFTVKWFDSGKDVIIEALDDARISGPTWSYDGKKIAFRHDLENGVELLIANTITGKVKVIPNLRLVDVLGSAYSWTSDNRHLLVRAVPAGQKAAPEKPLIPQGPVIEETSGKFAKVQTYQDLLKTPYDEDLFEYYANTQLVFIDSETGEIETIGNPGLIMGADESPDGRFILIEKLKRPFSYRVPYYYFTRTTEVWDRNGTLAATIADLPISDEIPTQGVPIGPRDVEWQTLKEATLVWAEALDGGDPMKKVDHRDKILIIGAPFTSKPTETLKLQYRYQGIEWTAKKDQVIITEFDRDRRWRTSAFIDLKKPAATRKVVIDLSINDAYNDPGMPVYETTPNGESFLVQDGDWIYLSGSGASDAGDRPKLTRFNLKTLNQEILFRCDTASYERFITFVKCDRKRILTRYETISIPPNYFITNLSSGKRTSLTDFKDPAPQLTSVTKSLMKYYRADGVQLSGTLYLPPGYMAGTKLPLIIWAYPMEYSDPSTAGQVRGSPNSFTFFRGSSPLFFLTQGYAVLMDATMPVVGDPETMNNTFIEQIVNSGRAAIDKLDSIGVADRKRVLVMGHSYGAFMTANLLAHSDDFAAGIARSGAYNRSLTPFGFQSERRSFWEAPDIYMKVSPFTYASKINEPILLIHGEADNNPGTYTMQSERLYQAIKGNGGTARLVLLPYESHGYIARESVLHTLAEMFEWADKYVKNK